MEGSGVYPALPRSALVRATRRRILLPALRLPRHRHFAQQITGRERRHVEVVVEQRVPGRDPLRRVVLDEALEERVCARRRVRQQVLQRDRRGVRERDLGVVWQV